MKRISRNCLILLAGVGILTLPVEAQTKRTGDRGNRQERGGQRPDPAQMQERLLEMMKTKLEVTDEIWSAIKPLVQEVMTKQREAGGAMNMMRGMRQRPGAEESQRQRPEEPEAVAKLRQALESDSESSDLQTLLKNYRSYKAQQQQALSTARENLRKVLNSRQEAQLVLMGLLD